MHGNLWEFCLDEYEADITSKGGAVNTTGSGTRVLRGGSIKEKAGNCRPAYRGGSTSQSYTGNWHIGFRVVCTAGLD